MRNNSQESSDPPPDSPTFILDVAFPQNIVAAVLDKWVPDLVLRPWQELADPTIAHLEDHDLILALHQRGYDALVTVDYKMLEDPVVLAMIQQTRFTVVACKGSIRKGVGDDPIAATGLLLMNLPNVSRHFVRDRAQAWMLKATVSPLPTFKTYLKEVEERFGFDTRKHHLSRAELAKPLAPKPDQTPLF